MGFELYKQGIRWLVGETEEEHTDELEMSGQGVDLFVRYGVDKMGTLILSRHFVFPTLRTIPNNTHASFQKSLDLSRGFLLCGKAPEERAVSFYIHGMLKVRSVTPEAEIERTLYPSSESLCAVEKIVLTAKTPLEISPDFLSPELIARGRGTKGCYRVERTTDLYKTALGKGERLTFYIYYTARVANQPIPTVNGKSELAKRKKRMLEIGNNCRFSCDDNLLTRFYNFAKLRACESVFKTDGGLLHSPGGRHYYAATWCNDQLEYAAPFFGMTFDNILHSATKNAFDEYIPFMDDDFHSIPSSVIAEGRDIWEGAGDRGDAAMFLYGASLYCLFSGNKEETKHLLPALDWCAEYCERKKLKEGVISSDSDELEGRIPTDGKANLSTSCLCYGGLNAAALVFERMGDKEKAKTFRARAKALEKAIEDYFGRDLHGFHTYRYSNGFSTLRSWICLPLAVGINKRAKGTVDALLSSFLRGEHGMLSCEKGEENTSDTVWDRAALYAYKGALLAGCGERIADDLDDYMKKRMLGKRVPYPVEAYPEGNMRHLSAESALFCRVITEGFFGIRPVSGGFEVKVNAPRRYGDLSLENIDLGGSVCCIFVKGETVTVTKDGRIAAKGKRNETLVF